MKARHAVVGLVLWVAGIGAPAFAYTVVFSSGDALEVTKPPECAGALCILHTMDGAILSARADRIDFVTTAEANRIAPGVVSPAAPQTAARPRHQRDTVVRFTNDDLKLLNGHPYDGIVRNQQLETLPEQAEVTGDRAPRPVVTNTPEITDSAGRGEEYWRSRAESLARDIQRARGQVDLDRKDYEENNRAMLFGRWIAAEPVEGGRRPSFGVLEYPRSPEERSLWFYRLEESRKRLAQSQMEMQLLEQERTDLAIEARRAGAMPGWLTIYY